jgi:hypothetical protein
MGFYGEKAIRFCSLDLTYIAKLSHFGLLGCGTPQYAEQIGGNYRDCRLAMPLRAIIHKKQCTIELQS